MLPKFPSNDLVPVLCQQYLNGLVLVPPGCLAGISILLINQLGIVLQHYLLMTQILNRQLKHLIVGTLFPQMMMGNGSHT